MAVKRNSSYTVDVELSVSRINRLLRPLRNKCANLATATSRPSGSAVPITYGSSSSSSVLETRVPPPLDVLRDPKLVLSRVHQESRFSDSLARQIYAVTNAYRNVLQAALPGGRGDDDGCRRRDVMALTDICAASVGRNIRGEVALCLATLEGELDEARETAVVDEVYESVSVRFRSWTLIAHATSEIVEGCSSHHPMLMLSLLGVTLAHGLYTESKIFLRLFLTALFRQPPRHGVAPPIAHPMHPSYLVELCQEWTRLAPGSCAGPFTLRSFAAVTLEVLAEHGSAAAWTCKSITRLVQLLRTRDFECFLTFLHGLIEALAARPRHSARGREEDHSLLHPRLAKWTGVITSDFFVEEDARRCGAGNSRSYSHLEFYSIVEILASAHDAGLHLPVIDDDDDPDVRAPQAALVCAATHCLTSPLFSTVNTAHRHAVLALLHNVNIASAPPTTSTPTTTTTTTTTTTIFDILANQPLARLRTLAAALRAHNLGALEQALWTCAIEHGADPALVDVPAESVCVWEGGDVVAGRGRIRRAAPTRSPPRKRKRPHRETPPPRRASQRQQLPSPSPSPSSSSSSSSMSISVASTPPLSSAASSSSSTRSLPGTPVPSLGEIMARPSGDEDEEATQRPCAGVAMRLRGDSFKSVLADALRTRKDLRAERRRASSLRTIGRYYVCSVSSERGYSREEDAAALALSSEGDVLDMFAYDDPF